MYRYIIIFLTLFALSSCLSPAELARQAELKRQRELSEDRVGCVELGFKPNTNNFANCMLEYKKIRVSKELESEKIDEIRKLKNTIEWNEVNEPF